jgi:hypothetical protein
MLLFYPGEKLTVQYKNRKSGFEADEIPNEAMDRLCECVTRDDNTITLRFPHPVKMRDGTWQDELTIPIRHKLYRFEREELVHTPDYPRGKTPETHMVPVEQLWESYWLKVWGKEVAEWLVDSPVAFKGLEEAIKREGLRAPLLVHKDGSARGGSHRLLVVKRMGWKDVECFITNTTGGTL